MLNNNKMCYNSKTQTFLPTKHTLILFLPAGQPKPSVSNPSPPSSFSRGQCNLHPSGRSRLLVGVCLLVLGLVPFLLFRGNNQGERNGGPSISLNNLTHPSVVLHDPSDVTLRFWRQTSILVLGTRSMLSYSP